MASYILRTLLHKPTIVERDTPKEISPGFPKTSRGEWLEKIRQDLKLEDLSSLVSHLPDQIDIQPVYHREDEQVQPQPFRAKGSWGILGELMAENEREANQKALQALESGVSGLLFYLQGTENLSLLFKGIQLQHIQLRLVVNQHVDELTKNFISYLATQNLHLENLDVFINHDPLENLARTGKWFEHIDQDFRDLKKIGDALLQPGGACLNVNLFGNAGASAAQQLGIALSMAYETSLRLQASHLRHYWVNFAIGSEYFLEIAKFRAFRRLWDQLNKELGFPHCQPRIYAETGLRNKSIRDAYNNMIRSTGESMAAIIGGADEVLVRSFDQTFGEASPFGERMARNQLNILQHESHLDAVRDIAKGSYFVENITEQLAQRGWDFFKKIEVAGGYLAAMQTGWLQDKIDENAAAEQKAYDEQEKELIGVNVYQRDEENLKTLVTTGHFAVKPPENTPVRPIIPRRLAENFEEDFK